MKYAPEDLVDAKGIARVGRVTRSRAYQWIAKKDFPKPVITDLNGGRVWDLNEVNEWRRRQLEALGK